MTNAEFPSKLNAMFAEYPLIARSKTKSLNELIYVLRMQNEEYQLNTISAKDGSFSCIPSAKETFVPSRDLAKKIVSIEFDEDAHKEYVINLLIVKLK